jgi:DNA-binding NtrC family response regulator
MQTAQTEMLDVDERRTVSDLSTRVGRDAPVVLVVTRDGELRDRVASAAPPSWVVETSADGPSSRERLAARDVRLVVIDDAALLESERGWLVDRVRQRAPDAAIVYIASSHAPELERAVRARGVLHYTSRPVDLERLDRVLGTVFRRK